MNRRAEELPFEQHAATRLVDVVVQVVLVSALRVSAVNAEERHACPIRRGYNLLHPGNILLVYPGVQVADELVIDQAHGGDLVRLKG